MEAIVQMIGVAEPQLKVRMLQALHTILSCGDSEEEENKLAEYLDSLGGVTKISDLQYDKNEEVYKNAVAILKDFYITEEAAS